MNVTDREQQIVLISKILVHEVKRPTHSRGSGACGIRYMGTRLVKYLSG
jgi:hypothetical protein